MTAPVSAAPSEPVAWLGSNGDLLRSRWGDDCEPLYTAASIESIQQDAQALRDDAERYRFLRNKVSGHGHAGSQSFGFPTRLGLPPVGNVLKGSVAQHLDKAIDAARTALGRSE